MATRGREYKPTDSDRLFVERAVQAGSKIEDIAAALNIHDDTLRKHFRYEIVTGRERMKGEAVRVVMDSLTDGSLEAAKFVLARVAGWTERQEHDLRSSDGTMTPKDGGSALDRINSRLDSLIAARSEDSDTQRSE